MNTHIKFVIIAALFFTTSAVYAATDSFNRSQPTDKIGQSISSSMTKKDMETTTTSTLENESTANSSSEETVQPTSTEPVVSEEAVSETTTSESTIPTETETTEPAETVSEEIKTEEANALTEEVPESTDTEETVTTQQSIQANQLKINDQFISYTNAGQGNGQAIIDADHNQVATWGGASVQSGEDGSNTHFIGHNPGIFSVLFSLNTGSVIEVSDANNNMTQYTVNQIVTVNDSATGTDGVNYWDQITSTDGGERITLQTCIDDNYNLIIFANK
ncbi:class F sortase [Enterococcus hermanniensis]|uniref:Sortase n=1 Tax=Enterococcus hermanniensis TaxID=249189 RepID=A0A1L8TP91_9ENTE|nr:class F sortase [Enterococcus hermanniensis]OJG46136.1 hypothetical protein RV04_GL001302 [Enterococcus hermanniensis]